MSKKDHIRRLWVECFGDSPEYTDMYFSRVYTDDNTLTADDADGRIVSSVQIFDYDMTLDGHTARLCYLGGGTTARRHRGRGYMSRLMLRALDESVARGAMMCALIPAHDWLYSFFERFGFSNVYLADRQCYTSFHPFPTRHVYRAVDDHYGPEVYESFHRYELERPGGVIHSRRDFLNVLDDLRFRPGGTFVVVGRDDVEVAGMAWAVDAGGFVRVNELLGVDDDARTAALQALRKRFPDRQFTVLAPAADNTGRHLYSRGMGRLVDVKRCLDTLADAHPEWSVTIRVTDPLIERNNRIFVVADGHCTADPLDAASRRLDFDVTVDVLTRIVFSSPSAGGILGFPTQRTHLSLMLH